MGLFRFARNLLCPPISLHPPRFTVLPANKSRWKILPIFRNQSPIIRNEIRVPDNEAFAEAFLRFGPRGYSTVRFNSWIRGTVSTDFNERISKNRKEKGRGLSLPSFLPEMDPEILYLEARLEALRYAFLCFRKIPESNFPFPTLSLSLSFFLSLSPFRARNFHA